MFAHRTCYPTLRFTSFRLYGVIRISCLWHEAVGWKFWLGVSYNFNAYKKAGAGKVEGEDRTKIRTGV